ncbi:MAG: protoporphyrinogen oxidase HemJ [Gammaproteobacteria bacterium]
MYLWIKAFHLVAVVAWFAGLFYLPRLFVYHAGAQDDVSIARFKIMERRLFFGITTPSALVAAFLGLWLIALQGIEWLANAGWLQAKLLLVAILLTYHVYLGYLTRRFALDENVHTDKFYRWINEFPLLILVGVIVLAEVKPF